MENLLQDVRYALRFLGRSPGFALVAVTSLAVGIGVNAALFAVVDALLLRPLPVARPEALVDIFTSGSGGETYQTSSYPDYLDFRAESDVFEDVAGHTLMFAAQNLEDRSRLVLGEVVTGNYFRVLGIEAARGRTLLPEDDRPGAERVVMVSHRYWQRELGGDPSVVGRTLRLRGQAYAIVGVAPPGWSGLLPMLAAEIWLPAAQAEEVEPAGIQEVVPSLVGNTRLERRGTRWLFLKGRLRPGATIEQAQARLEVVMARLRLEHPQTNGERKVTLVPTRGLRVHPQADAVLLPVAGAAMGFVGLVLLIACANVAALLLARASARRREIGIRMAVGASRGRVVRQLLAESVLLSLLGGLAGAALAWATTRFLMALPLPVPVPLSFDLRLDLRVLAFTFGAALLAGLLAGLAPALRASRPDLVTELRGETPAGEAGGRRFTFRDALVATQMAVTFVLLVAAGLVGGASWSPSAPRWASAPRASPSCPPTRACCATPGNGPGSSTSGPRSASARSPGWCPWPPPSVCPFPSTSTRASSTCPGTLPPTTAASPSRTPRSPRSTSRPWGCPSSRAGASGPRTARTRREWRW